MFNYRMGRFLGFLSAVIALSGASVYAAESDYGAEESVLMEEIREHIVRQDSSLDEAEIEGLVKELYQEKYVDSPVMVISDQSEEDIRAPYERMMAKENYIVDLIGLHSGEETSRQAWEYNLEYLKQNYEDLLNMEDVNVWYIDSYIEDYEIVRATQDMPESRVNEVSSASNDNVANDQNN